MLSHHHHHDCDHDHAEEEKALPAADPASQSLSEAMRISFKLLTIIMLLVLVAFAFTGVRMIEANEVGIKTVFGKVVGVADQGGLTFSWPYPVGNIEIVKTSEQRLDVNDFWMYESPEDRAKPMQQRRASSPGLRPGFDGALLTGDRGLMHVQLTCNYQVRDALAYRRSVRESYQAAGKQLDVGLRDLLHDVVADAAIRSASTRTAESLKAGGKDAFALAVMQTSQSRLDELLGRGAVAVTKVIPTQVEWPLQARDAYEKAQLASRERETKVRQAINEADQALKNAVGIIYPVLVGVPWQQQSAAPATMPADQPDAAEHDLIGQYIKTRREIELARNDAAAAGDPQARQQKLAAVAPLEARAAALHARIDEVLMSSSAGGEVSVIRGQAIAANAQIVKGVEGRLAVFRSTLPGFLQSPARTMELRWADVREAILSWPTVEKYYLSLDDGKTIVRLNADPEIRKQIYLDLMRARQDKEKAAAPK
jgi:regulator of protease activity HflC (stomatin/prohibitin superfamily)